MQSIKCEVIQWPYDGANSKGYPLKLMLYIDGSRSYQKTNYSVREDQWDKKKKEVIGHPNSKLINAALRKLVHDLEVKIAKEEIRDVRITKELFKEKKISFNEFCRSIKGDNSITNSQIVRITKYLGREPSIHEINIDFLRRYTLYLEKGLISSDKKKAQKPLHNNTIHDTESFFKRILGQAKKEHIIQFCPFRDGGYVMKSFIQPEVTWLEEAELQQFVDLLGNQEIMNNPDYYQVLCYFLLGCYTGLRHSDWGQFDPVKRMENGRLKLQAKKNKEWLNVPLGDTAIEVINRIKNTGPLTLDNEKCNNILRIICGYTNVAKHITTHVGRHTFGYTCAMLGFSTSLTAQLMGITTQAVEVYFHLTGANVTKQAAALKEL